MTRSKFLFFGSLVLLAVFVTSGCGKSSRQLQSVAIAPTATDAKNYANSQVLLTATGTYNKPPSPVQLTSQDVVWCAGTSDGFCDGFVAPSVIVDQNGMAQCSPTFVGTGTVLAGAPAPSMVIGDGGSHLKVFGSAQVTCP
jgi:hypothetical protein